MLGNLAYQAYHLIWLGMDLLFPPECGGCGKKGSRWCVVCHSNSDVIGNNCCEVCGDITVKTGVCQRCEEERPVYRMTRSWAVYTGPIRNLIIRLKYKRDIGLGDAIAKPMVEDLKKIGWTIDMVIPAPLSLARMAERGYNQAALIAYPLALGMSLPYQPKALRKTKDTRSQVGLGFDERRVNLIDAFIADENIVRQKRVLVVDDVTTSGATLNECAASLKAAGVHEVYGYTFARASHNKSTMNTDL